MFKSLLMFMFILGAIAGPGLFPVWAQDSMETVLPQTDHSVIDSALDESEGYLHRRPAEGPGSDSGSGETAAASPIPAPAQTRQDFNGLKAAGDTATNDPSSGVLGVTEPEQEPLLTKTIPLIYADAQIVQELLYDKKSPRGEVVFNAKNQTLTLTDAAEHLDAMSAYVTEIDVPLETEVFKLNHVNVEDVIEKITAVLTKGIGNARADRQANTLTATDTPLRVGAAMELVKKLDRVSKEILFTVKVLKVVLNDEYQEGVDWEAIVSQYQSVEFPDGEGSSQVDGRQLAVGVISTEDYVILLDALDTVGFFETNHDETVTAAHRDARAVRVTGPRNTQAEATDGRQDSGEEDSSEQQGTSGTENAEIIYGLIPTLQRDGTVTVELEPGYSGSADAGAGSCNVSVEDGATIVIGGLFEDTTVESSWKIPLLGDLPLLGFVFRNQGETLRKAEVMTFITVQTVEKGK